MLFYHRVLPVLLLLLMTGCGSQSLKLPDRVPSVPEPTGPQARAMVEVIFQDSEPPAGVDAAHLLFFDRDGRVVFGPIETELDARAFSVEDVPVEATRVEVDYLQNGGLALFESFHELDYQESFQVNARSVGATVVDPMLQAAGESRSVWRSSVRDGNGEFYVSTQGQPGLDTGPTPESTFSVRGVCYSPAPIGSSNRFGPNVGDLFWDSHTISIDGRPTTLLDWEKVWKRDLEKIRGDFNSLRTYCMISYQTNAKDEGIANSHKFTHHKFLDECWNNGKNPVYVLVGIPLPGSVLLPGGDAADRDFWLENFRQTVRSVGAHPAVMGFTIFNEVGGLPEWGGDTGRSEFYWSQIETLSGFVKSEAPDKLVGFSWFDNPSAVRQANDRGLLERYASSLDFYGVNSFQSSLIDPTLAPYTQLGAASKPVMFTEFGLPGTTRTDTSTCSGASPSQASVNSIVATPASLQKTASALDFILPRALNAPIVVGMMYFEWNDEWWKQDSIDGCYVTDITKQEGGQRTGEPFPNGYNDEEAYGLHSIALNGRSATQVFEPFNTGARTANNFPDILTEKTELYSAVKRAFQPVR